MLPRLCLSDQTIYKKQSVVPGLPAPVYLVDQPVLTTTMHKLNNRYIQCYYLDACVILQL